MSITADYAMMTTKNEKPGYCTSGCDDRAGFWPLAGAGACPVLDTGTESIAVALGEGARTRQRPKDKRDKSAG